MNHALCLHAYLHARNGALLKLPPPLRGHVSAYSVKRVVVLAPAQPGSHRQSGGVQISQVDADVAGARPAVGRRSRQAGCRGHEIKGRGSLAYSRWAFATDLPVPLAAVLGNSHVLGAAPQLLCVCARASQKTCAVPRSTGLSTRTVCPSPTTKRLPSPSALPAAPGRSCVLVLTPPCAPVQTLLRATHLSVRCSAATQRNTARSVHCNRASGRERRCGGLQRHGHVLRAGEPRVCVLWTPWTPVHSCITPGAFNRLAPAKPSPCLVLGRSGTWIRKKPPLPLTTGAHHPEWAGGSMPARC